MAERRYWIFKSEPNNYSFADLLGEEDQTAEWDGVRNYQVRNFMRDEMKAGDGVLFYHSSAKPMAVMGTAYNCGPLTGPPPTRARRPNPIERTGTEVMRALLKFLKDESGPTAVEYAVLVALIIITAMAAIASVGDSALFMWNDLVKNGLDLI